MRSFLIVAVVVAVMFSIGVWAQQPAQQGPLSPEQGLGVLSQAASMFKGTLQEHMIIQQSEQTIAAALKIYRVYVPITAEH